MWSVTQDVDLIYHKTRDIWPQLRGARFFMTGGTGFIGRWMLESLMRANDELKLEITVTVLSRDPSAFERKVPHLASSPTFEFISGDVCTFESPAGEFTHVIHAATDASAHLNDTNPLKMFDTVVNGTRRTLTFASEKRVERVLFLSSGAVYGQQPWDMINVPESWIGGPSTTDPQAAYAEGKRAAEMLCTIYQKQHGLQIAISRIFALLGPYLPLDIHFAAGNFIRDAMKGEPVVVNGDGLACRSYLYIADLVVWLWHMLVRAESGKPYNCGSDETISIRKLAELISRIVGNGEYQVLGASDAVWNPGRYVPDTTLINNDLGLYKTISLEEAIRRTAYANGWKEKRE